MIMARRVRGAADSRVHSDTCPGGVYVRLEDRGHTLGRFMEFVTARLPESDEVTRCISTPARPSWP